MPRWGPVEGGLQRACEGCRGPDEPLRKAAKGCRGPDESLQEAAKSCQGPMSPCGRPLRAAGTCGGVVAGQCDRTTRPSEASVRGVRDRRERRM